MSRADVRGAGHRLHGLKKGRGKGINKRRDGRKARARPSVSGPVGATEGFTQASHFPQTWCSSRLEMSPPDGSGGHTCEAEGGSGWSEN